MKMQWAAVVGAAAATVAAGVGVVRAQLLRSAGVQYRDAFRQPDWEDPQHGWL